MKINLLVKKIHRGALSLFLFSFCTFNSQLNFAQTTNSGIIPIHEKGDPSVSLIYKDTLVIPSFTEFNIPVKMMQGNEISAISLGFYFPKEYLEVTGMEMANGTTGFSYSVIDSLFRMAWSNVYPLDIGDEDTIITLRMRSLDLADLNLSIKLVLFEFTEFADSSANVIEGVVLEIPEIQYLVPDPDDTLSGNYVRVYPNPFEDYTLIDFYLEGESIVKISLFNMIGLEMGKAEEATYPKGTHQVKLYAVDLSKGIYLLKFEIINGEKSVTKLIKILVAP